MRIAVALAEVRTSSAMNHERAGRLHQPQERENVTQSRISEHSMRWPRTAKGILTRNSHQVRWNFQTVDLNVFNIKTQNK